MNRAGGELPGGGYWQISGAKMKILVRGEEDVDAGAIDRIVGEGIGLVGEDCSKCGYLGFAAKTHAEGGLAGVGEGFDGSGCDAIGIEEEGELFDVRVREGVVVSEDLGKAHLEEGKAVTRKELMLAGAEDAEGPEEGVEARPVVNISVWSWTEGDVGT